MTKLATQTDVFPSFPPFTRKLLGELGQESHSQKSATICFGFLQRERPVYPTGPALLTPLEAREQIPQLPARDRSRMAETDKSGLVYESPVRL